MLLRSEMREEVRERRRNHGKMVDGERSGKLEFFRGGRRELATSRDYEERVTYRTITRTEFQKRRASFESHDEATVEGKTGKIGTGEGNAGAKTLRKKTRSLDELTRKEDSHRSLYRESEMTDKLEDIHRMIVDMQEMTKQLKDRNYSGGEKGEGKLRKKSIGMTPPKASPTEVTDLTEKPLLLCGPARAVKPVRYRSTILIAIGSKWRRFKEEIEIKIDF